MHVHSVHVVPIPATTIFTRMQTTLNLRWPHPHPPKKSAHVKCIYPNLRWSPKNKTSANKKYFTINFINLMHRVCHMLSNFTSLPVSALIFLTLLTSPSSSLSFNYISPVPSTASNIHHFLKPFTVNSGEMSCYITMIHTDSSWFINLYEPMKIYNFLHNGVSGVKNFKFMCSGFLCCVYGLISLCL